MELLYYTTFCKICLLNRKRMPVKSGNPTNISAINRQNEQLPVSVHLIGMEHCLIVSHIKDIRTFLGSITGPGSKICSIQVGQFCQKVF